MDAVFMKILAEAIVKAMLFCQHIQEAKNDGLELGLLDLFGGIVW